LCKNQMALITMEEDFSWEIKYDKAGKPFYYNRFAERSLQCRPTCLENGGRVSIREPVIEALYKGLWYKGILLGPADRVTFSVQLEQAPVQLLDVDRSGIRKWSYLRRHTVPSSAQRGNSELSSNDDTNDMKELFEDNTSLSKLSRTMSEKCEEKYDFEISQSKGHYRNGKASGSFTVSVSDDRARSKSWGCVAKQNVSPNGCGLSEEEDDEDFGNLAMLPLKANPNGEAVRRNKRLNAVLLDQHDLSSIKTARLPSSKS